MKMIQVDDDDYDDVVAAAADCNDVQDKCYFKCS